MAFKDIFKPTPACRTMMSQHTSPFLGLDAHYILAVLSHVHPCTEAALPKVHPVLSQASRSVRIPFVSARPDVLHMVTPH